MAGRVVGAVMRPGGGGRARRGASAGSCPVVPAAAGGARWVGGVRATARPATPGRRFELDPLPVELALQHRELVAEGEDFCVFVMIAAWQQPQHREHVGDAEVGQSPQHEAASSRSPDDDDEQGVRPDSIGRPMTSADGFSARTRLIEIGSSPVTVMLVGVSRLAV